jgi:hypothetical protein
MCLAYFELQGRGCDCEVVLNVDVAKPNPLYDFNCVDCGNDYDEDYLVREEIWKSCSGGEADLCIGCLETRLGRELCRRDFVGAQPKGGSLRLQDRLARRRRAD